MRAIYGPYGGAGSLAVRADRATGRRTLSQHLGDIANVKNFGAVGDGYTDDTDAFHEAARSLTNGGILFVPAGFYCFTSQIRVGVGQGSQFISLEGEGESSVLVCKVQEAVAAVYIGDAVSVHRDMAVRNLRITGEWLDGSGVNGGTAETELLQFNECLEGVIENVRLDWGANDGLQISGSEAAKIIGCTIRDNLGWGAIIGQSEDAGSNGPLVRFQHNMCKDNGNGLRVRVSSGHIIRDNVFESNAIGVQLADTGECTVDSNKFEGNSTIGLRIGDGTNRATAISIIRNYFSAATEGINFDNYINCIAWNNWFITDSTVTFGADEANNYTEFRHNLISLDNITVTAPTQGKVVIEDNIEAGTDDRQQPFPAQDTTPSVKGVTSFRTANTMATLITNFDDGYTGKIICIIAGDALTTLVDGATLALSTGANMTLASGDMIVLQAFSGSGATQVPVWRDIAFFSTAGVQAASSGTFTVKSANASSADTDGWYEVAPSIWVPYTTDPTP